MNHTEIWILFGDTITTHPYRTLAAYLGDPGAREELEAISLAGPSKKDFEDDPAFEPNPHGLDLDPDLLNITLLVHSLAVWGPVALIHAAAACARLQIDKHETCLPELLHARNKAHEVVCAFCASPSNDAKNVVRRAAEDCAKLYQPHEDSPDEIRGQQVWNHLGAPWFAAETIAQEYRLQSYDGKGLREASSAWCRRNAVWPIRAAVSVLDWAPFEEVDTAIRNVLLGNRLRDAMKFGL